MNGCRGSCNQGRTSCDCMRWDGTSRPAPLDEVLPDTPDPAWGRNGRWYAVFLVLGCFVVALALSQWLRGV